MANGVKFFSYVVTDGLSMIQVSDIVKAINFAINEKVDVINLSFGSYDYSIEEEKVIKKALDNGIVVVASFGNKGDTRGLYPAILDGVISVGAVDKDNDLLMTSSYGENLCVVAPGSNIIGAVGNGCFSKWVASGDGSCLA